MFNDGVVILDEIGQATSENVSQIAYMLPNSQGKERVKSDGSRNRLNTWLLNFLSTGEVAIVDKIEESGKFRGYSAQKVRVIELPIDAGDGSNVVEDFHGFENSDDFINMLSRNSKKYYGSALRLFLSSLIKSMSDDPSFVSQRLNEILKFEKRNCPEGSSGQVLRVARKFSLIAVAGELAIDFKVFPYVKGEACKLPKSGSTCG
jgi:uncharacterized protein (DUF927 family)